MMVVKIIATVQLCLFLLWECAQNLKVVGMHENQHPGRSCPIQGISAVLSLICLVETGVLIFLIA